MSTTSSERTPTTTTTSRAEDLAGKYLTFRLHREDYGVSINHVREIIAIQDITPLPRMPEHICGVINLRGRIIPIVDLRIQLGLVAAAYTGTTCIVVIHIERGYDGLPAQIGCIVDTVSEVLTIDARMIEAPPKMVSAQCVDSLLGLGKIGDPAKVVALLDIDAIVRASNLLEETARAVESSVPSAVH